jgi:hypothetical protein
VLSSTISRGVCSTPILTSTRVLQLVIRICRSQR